MVLEVHHIDRRIQGPVDGVSCVSMLVNARSFDQVLVTGTSTIHQLLKWDLELIFSSFSDPSILFHEDHVRSSLTFLQFYKYVCPVLLHNLSKVYGWSSQETEIGDGCASLQVRLSSVALR
jgi:hypothetical protein